MTRVPVTQGVLEQARGLLVPSDRLRPSTEDTAELIRRTLDAGETLLGSKTADTSAPLSGPALPLFRDAGRVQLSASTGLPMIMVASGESLTTAFGVILGGDGGGVEVVGALYARRTGDAVSPTSWWSYREHSGQEAFVWGFASAGVRYEIDASRPVGSGPWRAVCERSYVPGEAIQVPEMRGFAQPQGERSADSMSSTSAGARSRLIGEPCACATAQVAFDAMLPLVTPRPDDPDSRLRHER